jgi:gamma-glutamylcysteine synthetase
LEIYKKNRRKTKTTSPPIREHSTPPGSWAKSDKEKAELFAEHLSEVFSQHNNDQDQEVEQDLATAIQSQERLKAFTLKEIKDVIKMLNQKKRDQVSTLLLPEC